MIETETIGPVLRLRMARAIFGRAIYHTAAYRVGTLLVDSGCAHTLGELLAILDGGPRIEQVVCTHSHEDHVAGNRALAAGHGARLLAHPLAVPVLAAPRELQPQQLYRRILWGYPEPSTAFAIGDELEADGRRYRVIHTPGHSPDHICLLEPREGWLFTGDAFVGGQDRALRREADVHAIIRSLRLLLELDPRVLFPGSGTVYCEPRQVLREKIEYLEQLGDRVHALAARGLSVRRIRRRLLGPEPWIATVTQGDFTGENLIRSFLGHDPEALAA
jgi:glyoxylase-like metal-dependent hydrolase (beta-lactamase superfamily II)